MPSTPEVKVPARTQRLLDALKAAGWTLRPGRFPGHYGADAPCTQHEVATPGYIARHIEFHSGRDLGPGCYPFPTYRPMRQIWFSLDGDGRLSAVFTRQGTPWVGAREAAVSLSKALAYIAQPVDDAGRPIEPAAAS